MQIHYKGSITKQDFLQCVILMNSSLKWQRWFFGSILAAIALSLIYLWLEGSTDTVQTFVELGPTSLIPIGFLLFPWWLPYLQSASYNQKPNIYRKEVFGTIDDKELTISNGEIRAAFQWSAFTGYIIKKDLFLLRQGKYGFSAFKPSMFSSNQDWEEFISVTKKKILSK